MWHNRFDQATIKTVQHLFNQKSLPLSSHKHSSASISYNLHKSHKLLFSHTSLSSTTPTLVWPSSTLPKCQCLTGHILSKLLFIEWLTTPVLNMSNPYEKLFQRPLTTSSFKHLHIMLSTAQTLQQPQIPVKISPMCLHWILGFPKSLPLSPLGNQPNYTSWLVTFAEKIFPFYNPPLGPLPPTTKDSCNYIAMQPIPSIPPVHGSNIPLINTAADLQHAPQIILCSMPPHY